MRLTHRHLYQRLIYQSVQRRFANVGRYHIATHLLTSGTGLFRAVSRVLCLHSAVDRPIRVRTIVRACHRALRHTTFRTTVYQRPFLRRTGNSTLNMRVGRTIIFRTRRTTRQCRHVFLNKRHRRVNVFMNFTNSLLSNPIFMFYFALLSRVNIFDGTYKIRCRQGVMFLHSTMRHFWIYR